VAGVRAVDRRHLSDRTVAVAARHLSAAPAPDLATAGGAAAPRPRPILTAAATDNHAALAALEKDATVRDLLGKEFVRLFLAVKRHETPGDRARPRPHRRRLMGRVDELEIAELFEFL
jgi:hypothetical protein